MYMNRYQVYLDPKSVKVIDGISSELSMTRSRIIQEVVNRVAREFEKVLTVKKNVSQKNNPLLKMAGFIKGTKPGISRNIDEIYFKD